MRKKIGKKKVSVEAQAPVEGLNLDLLLSTYKNNFTKDTPLEPLIVLSDDEDINDYMDNDDTDNNEPSQIITNVEEIDTKNAEPAVEEACLMDVADDDSVAMSSTEKESDGTAGSPILSLMMVLQQILKSCNIANSNTRLMQTLAGQDQGVEVLPQQSAVVQEQQHLHQQQQQQQPGKPPRKKRKQPVTVTAPAKHFWDNIVQEEGGGNKQKTYHQR